MLKRWQSGLWGILSFTVLVVLVVGILVLLEMPAAVVWSFGLLTGFLLLLTTIGARRGAQERSQNFGTFESNALGDPATEEFQAPYHRALAFDPAESVLFKCAPILQTWTGLGDLFKRGSWGFLGKGKITDGENALVLTKKRILFLMIGPDALKRFSADPRITRLLEAAPGDGSAKRRMLWRMGGAEVRAALSGLLAESSLEQLTHRLFNFSVPLDDIDAIGHSSQRKTLLLRMGEQRLQYCFQDEEDLAALVRALAGLGLSFDKGGKL